MSDVNSAPVSLRCAGKSTVNSVFGTRVAVLAGDYLFAQSSWYLANLDNLEVIKLISQARDAPSSSTATWCFLLRVRWRADADRPAAWGLSHCR